MRWGEFQKISETRVRISVVNPRALTSWFLLVGRSIWVSYCHGVGRSKPVVEIRGYWLALMFAAMLSKCFFEDMLPNSSLSYF